MHQLTDWLRFKLTLSQAFTVGGKNEVCNYHCGGHVT